MGEEDLMKAIVTLLLIVPLLSSCDSPETIYENFVAVYHVSGRVDPYARGCGPLKRSKPADFGCGLDTSNPAGAFRHVWFLDHFDGEKLSTATWVDGQIYEHETRDWTFLHTWQTWTTLVPVEDDLVLDLTRWASPQCSTSDWDEKENGILDGGAGQVDVTDEAASGDVDAGSYADSTLRSE